MGATFIRAAFRGSSGTRVVDSTGTGTDTSIASALSNLPSTGGCIYVREGTYTLSAGANIGSGFTTTTLTIDKDNTMIVGCGRGTIITTTQNMCMLDIKANNVTIKDILFSGGTGSLSRCIDSSKATPNTTTNVIIQGCYFENNVVPISLTNASGGSRWIIKNNFFTGNSSYAINPNAQYSNMIISNNYFYSGFGGIRIENGSSGFSIRNNTFDTLTTTAASIEMGGQKSVITGNVIRSGLGDGVRLFSTSQNIITGNSILTCAGFGINVGSSGTGINNIISSNDIQTNTSGQVTIGSGSDSNIIMRNILRGTPQITDGGANNLIYENFDYQ